MVMDLILKHKVAFFLLSLIIGHSNATTWNKEYGQNVASDSLQYPSLGETKRGFQPEEHSVKVISKRRADWSNRQPHALASSVQYKLDAQESEHVDVTTKMPRIVRKMRFQNVPQQVRYFEQNGNNVEKHGNDTITTDKQGRVIRVRKFRRKTTTTKPQVTTAIPITTSTTIPIAFKSITPQMTQYSHITVINKEIIDQKPNRKPKNKKQTKLWAPPGTVEESAPYKSETDLKAQKIDGTYNGVPNKSRGYRSFEADKRSDSDPMVETPTIHENTEAKSIIKNPPDTNVSPRTRTPEDEIKTKPQNNRPNLKDSAQSARFRDVRRLKPQQIRNASQTTDSTSTPSTPKSVEILSDVLPTQQSDTLQNNPQSERQDYDIENGVTTHSPQNTDIMSRSILPEVDLQPGQMMPNSGFRHFPQQGFQGYPYGPMDPFFRAPGAPLHGIQQPQNVNPLSPISFRQPFSPFYRQNNPQFQEYYAAPPRQISPYQGSLGTPRFYHSPQLESLRRSIIDTYAEEESIESTTEYSLPKFEIPSIDFNDKGCRTVYKEVSAVPAENSNPRKVENQAKSFVMTRECFFPDGVPTTRYTDMKDQTTPATKQIENT